MALLLKNETTQQMNPKITRRVNIKSMVKVTPIKEVHKSKQQQHGQNKDKGATDRARGTSLEEKNNAANEP